MTIEPHLLPYGINHSIVANSHIGLCIHTMSGSLNGTDAYFHNSASNVSAHYGVDLDGSRVYQWVKESETAWAEGRVDHPTFKMVLDRPGINPNSYLISIENADNNDPGGANRTKQYPILAQLVRDICLRNNIPIDRDHICGHKEIYSLKSCPGNLDIDKVILLASGSTPQTGVSMDLQTFLTKYNFVGLDDADRVVNENLGTTRGAESLPGGGFLADARRQVTALKAQLATQPSTFQTLEQVIGLPSNLYIDSVAIKRK